MACLSRIVVPDSSHHLARRGNRRQLLVIEPGDDPLSRELLALRCDANGVAC